MKNVHISFGYLHCITDVRESICGNKYAILRDEKGNVVLKGCYDYILEYVKRMGISTYECGYFSFPLPSISKPYPKTPWATQTKGE